MSSSQTYSSWYMWATRSTSDLLRNRTPSLYFITKASLTFPIDTIYILFWSTLKKIGKTVCHGLKYSMKPPASQWLSVANKRSMVNLRQLNLLIVFSYSYILLDNNFWVNTQTQNLNIIFDNFIFWRSRIGNESDDVPVDWDIEL